MEKKGNGPKDPLPMRALLVVYSYHQKNTEKIAQVIAEILDAQIKTPRQIHSEELQEYALLGFGSGIYDGKHHESLLSLADQLTKVTNGKAFLFSTCGVPAFGMTKEVMAKNHSLLREKLRSKGYLIVDEFSCAGHNTNSFLKLFGGINKGRPNAEDLERVKEFAQELKQHIRIS